MGFLVSTNEGGNFRLALADGGELDVQTTPSGGGGAVTSVTGTAPIVVSPTTGAVVVSTTLPADAWPVTSAIAASVSAPELGQAQAVSGGGHNITAFAQDAAVGSAATGGAWTFWQGYTDGVSTTPSRFTVKQATAPGRASGNIMLELFFNPATLVQSVGLGDPLAGLGGTQLVLQGASNSVVAHAYIGMFALDNATHGQAFIQIHDEDGSGTIPGAFYGYYDVFTSGTEQDDGLVLARNQHTAGSGGSHYLEGTNNTTFPTPAPVRRWSIDENAGQGNLVFYDSDGVSTSHANSWIRLPYANGNTVQPVITVRNAANSGDLTVVQVVAGELWWGDTASFNRLRFETISEVLFENVNATTGLWVWQNNTLGPLFKVESAPGKPIIHGGVDDTHDGIRRTIQEANFTGGTGALIATVTLVDNTTTALSVQVTMRDTVNGTDFCVATLASGYAKKAGVITSPAVAGTPVDVAHTAAAAGTAATLAFTVSGGTIQVTINSFGANLLHVLVAIREDVNTGTA